MKAFTTVRVLSALTVLAMPILATPRLRADAPPKPVININVPLTVHQGDNMVDIKFAIADADGSGLGSFTLSGANRTLINTFSQDVHSASGMITWTVKNYPVGDYTFTSRVTSWSGLETNHTVTVHLVP